jgi:hypothetical protein
MPTITNPNQYFDTTLWAGNGGTQTIYTTAQFQPDLVWIKGRTTGGYNHVLTNSVSGAQLSMATNTTDAEAADTNGLTAFTSTGFSVGSALRVNNTANNYVSWSWKAGGAAVTNTAGSITSQVSANTTSGFSIVTYTGTGSNATVGHGLGVTPSLVIVKNRTNGGSDWTIWQTTLSGTQYLQFNTNAILTNANRWNSTTPTSSVFSVGTSGDTNNSGSNFVAYCWAPIAGYSAFGSYTGNGSTDGPFVYTGFQPKFIIVKLSSGSGSGWLMYDSTRNPYNLVTLYTQANSANAEAGNSTDNPFDFLSNGFKLRYSNSATNQSSGTYIYAAFASNPFKYSNAF